MRAECLAWLEDMEAGLIRAEEHAGPIVGFDDAFVDAVARCEAGCGVATCRRSCGAGCGIADGSFVSGWVEWC